MPFLCLYLIQINTASCLVDQWQPTWFHLWHLPLRYVPKRTVRFYLSWLEQGVRCFPPWPTVGKTCCVRHVRTLLWVVAQLSVWERVFCSWVLDWIHCYLRSTTEISLRPFTVFVNDMSSSSIKSFCFLQYAGDIKTLQNIQFSADCQRL